jgi:hypothetical protein
MARLTMAQAYAYARQAGFDPAAATIAAAIAMAESGLNTGARGDVNLQTGHWGPSVGLMQIRTVKSDTGKGSDRDISRLDDPLQNMISAYNISGKGKDFSPWTTYTRGTYRQFLGQAGAAGGGDTDTGSGILPAGLLDGLTPAALADKARGYGLLLLAVAVGATLLIVGGKAAVT